MEATGRLAQGVGTRMPNGENTMFFVHPYTIPKCKKITHVKLVASIQTLKSDRLEYDGFTSTVPAALTTVKININSTISTPNSTYVSLDTKDYCYATPMENVENAQIPVKLIPQEIVDQHNLSSLAVNGKIYCEVWKGMPGLNQAGAILHKRLTQHLHAHGYYQARHALSLWKHKSLSISFTLVVDELDVKRVGKNDHVHLIATLEKHY